MAEKKKFHPIQIPLLNREIELLGYGESDFEGRYVKLDLTNSLKGKALELKLRVKEEKGKITASPVSAYLQGLYIRRMIRKGTDYVEDSFLTQCKNHRIRIKPFLITRKGVPRKVKRGLREKAKSEIIEYVKNKIFENLVLEIINNKLQKELMPKLKKIYPLGLCEIRFIGIEDSKEHEKYEEEQKAEEKVTEEKQKEDTPNKEEKMKIKKHKKR